MSIPLDQPTGSGVPAIKFGDIGSYADLGIVSVEQVQSRNYDTGEPELWPDGGTKTHPRITAIIIKAEGATIGKDDDEHAVAPGDLVALYAQGSRWFAYRDAVKEHGTVSVGDVMRWKFDRTEPARNARHAPRKVFEAKIRAPRGDDGDLMARCEAAHFELKNRTPVDTGAGGGGGSGYQPMGDEAPFHRDATVSDL